MTSQNLNAATKAGRLHNHLLSASRDTANGVDTLPGLILGMLEDDGWKQMIRPIDGRVFTHSSIEDWVLGEPWGGLNFKSWDMLYAILKRSGSGRRVLSMLVERGAPEDGFAEDVRQQKAAGKSLRQIARDKGVAEATVRRGTASLGRTDNRVVVYLAKDTERAAEAIITARGPEYAQELVESLSTMLAAP